MLLVISNASNLQKEDDGGLQFCDIRDDEEYVVVECDKGQGMSILPLDTVLAGEIELMTQLGATLLDVSNEIIVCQVEEKINAFERSLYNQQFGYVQFFI